MILSDNKTGVFGERIGCLLNKRRVLQHIIFIIERKGQVRNVDNMSILNYELIYERVINAARIAI